MPNLSFSVAEDYACQKELNAIYGQIAPYIQKTPLLKSPILSQLIAGQVFIKPESLQVTGAFKFRGALYRLMQLNKEQKKQGVAAYSSGNFARGLAQAGQILSIPVHLVMPFDAPTNKIENARKLGATITLCHQTTPSREEAASDMAADIAEKYGYTLLHPFDDPILIKGQATVGIELHQQLSAGGLPCHSLLCPSGGGSLVAGSSLTFSSEKTGTDVFAIEIENYNGMSQSLNNKKLSRAAGGHTSACDALLALTPGNSTFAIARKMGVKGLTVSEPFIAKALRLAFEDLSLVLEPSGAIAIAVVLEQPELFNGQTVVALASGGNVDLNKFIRLIERV